MKQQLVMALDGMTPCTQLSDSYFDTLTLGGKFALATQKPLAPIKQTISIITN